MLRHSYFAFDLESSLNEVIFDLFLNFILQANQVLQRLLVEEHVRKILCSHLIIFELNVLFVEMRYWKEPMPDISSSNHLIEVLQLPTLPGVVELFWLAIAVQLVVPCLVIEIAYYGFFNSMHVFEGH